MKKLLILLLLCAGGATVLHRRGETPGDLWAAWTEPTIARGMTREQLRGKLGEPGRVARDHTGRDLIWIWKNARFAVFSPEDRVIGSGYVDENRLPTEDRRARATNVLAPSLATNSSENRRQWTAYLLKVGAIRGTGSGNPLGQGVRDSKGQIWGATMLDRPARR
jgi:hypothetical protein